ncbi:MAG: metallopeptidase TldD-related protein [Planctomycetota bacterium]|nr:metallopeptidase TldD-related protein [Planctomycetota bacterium]
MQSWFYEIADYSESLLSPGEEISLHLKGERTGFSRISAGKIRQAGSIEQRNLELALRSSGREVRMNLMLSGDMSTDRSPLRSALDKLSRTLESLSEDPHLPPLPHSGSSESRFEGELPSKSEMIQTLAGEIPLAESCGIAMTGIMYRGMATSNAVRRWYEAPLTLIDGSMHLTQHSGAAKWTWSGRDWNPEEAQLRKDRALSSLELLSRPMDTPAAGEYRTWLEPAALRDLLGPLLWNGAFSARALAKGSSPFTSLHNGRVLDSRVSIHERPLAVGAPSFGDLGFSLPDTIPLIDSGVGTGRLTSPRTAMELGLDTNGVNGDEQVSAMEMSTGDLSSGQTFEAVGDGLWLSHVHYCNMAAREGARVTGVTRWIALRVRNGKPVGPVGTVRIDDSVLRLLGEGLLQIGDQSEILADTHSYVSRHPRGSSLPGILVDGLRVVA